MDDWHAFRRTSVFAELYDPARFANSKSSVELPADFTSRFPTLSQLLSSARQTVVHTSKGIRLVYGWTRGDGTIVGWVCYQPSAKTNLAIHPDHRLLLNSFGGINECWNEPNGLLNNLNGALGLANCAHGFGGKEDLFRQCCQINDYPMTIDPSDYLVFAAEANGDRFLYHKKTGHVMLLGFDTGRSNLEHVEGYWDLLYTVKGLPDLHAWIEGVAKEWANEIER